MGRSWTGGEFKSVRESICTVLAEVGIALFYWRGRRGPYGGQYNYDAIMPVLFGVELGARWLKA